jgi:hypothetical protein
MIAIIAKTNSSLSKKREKFPKFFGENILKIITSVSDEFVKKITQSVARPVYVKNITQLLPEK